MEARVLVVLPDGQVLPGWLQGRRRDPEGRWWYRTAVDIPAEAVQPVPGQDYDHVPTQIQETHPWRIQAPPMPEEDRIGILHRGDCTAAEGRLTPIPDDAQARVWLRESWAKPCEVCHPQP